MLKMWENTLNRQKCFDSRRKIFARKRGNTLARWVGRKKKFNFAVRGVIKNERSVSLNERKKNRIDICDYKLYMCKRGRAIWLHGSTIFVIGAISDPLVAVSTTESVQSRHLLRDFVRRWLTALRRATHAGPHRCDRRHVAHRRHYGSGPRSRRRHRSWHP